MHRFRGDLLIRVDLRSRIKEIWEVVALSVGVDFGLSWGRVADCLVLLRWKTLLLGNSCCHYNLVCASFDSVSREL